jgi:hypothetical protein
MEIQKFEAYTYKGPTLLKLTRKEVIEQLIDNLTNGNFGGYECNGSSYNINEEWVMLYLDKIVDGKSVDYKALKLDFSDMGIEIGKTTWDDKTEEDGFIPEINLDTDSIKKMKSYKTTLNKFNI